jgi:peptide/nickel transport system substrate-binding protein
VRDQLLGIDAHPVVRVGPLDAVLGVGEGPGRGHGRLLHSTHRSRRRVAAAVAAVLVAASAGLGLTAPAQAGDGGGTTFTVALLNEVDSFNPFLGIEAESYEMWALTYDYMISYSMEDMSPQPGLAREWETSDDGLTWTFRIRDGVTWSDGEPLTAADIAYTYNRILDGGPEAASWSSYLTSVTSIEAPDDTTVVLELDKPNAVLPLLPIPIVPEHVWKRVSDQAVKSYAAEPKDGEPVVGSGPFRLVEGTAGGSTYRFEANPDYWKGAPHVDQVVFRVYKAEDPAIQALRKGEVDFVEGISPIQVKALEGVEGITAHAGDSPGFDEIAFNTGSVNLDNDQPIGDPNPAVLDPAFRKALGYALDRDLIIEKAYQGAGKPGTTIIPPGYSSYHWEPPADQLETFDLDKAGQMLDDAGYTLGDDGRRVLPSGEPIGTLRLFARTESPTSVDVMDYFQEWLDELGIDAEVSAVESNKLTNIILEGEFDAFEWGWYVEPDPDSMLSYMTCGQRGNWSDSWYCNAEYDDLYKQQNAELDDEARAGQVQEMQEILYRDAPYLVTAYTTIGEAFRSDRFACFQPQPDPGGIWLIQYGVANYLNVRPADEAGDCGGITTAVGAGTDLDPAAAGGGDDEQGGNIALIAGGAVLLALLIGGGAVVARRRATAGDRE